MQELLIATEVAERAGLPGQEVAMHAARALEYLEAKEPNRQRDPPELDWWRSKAAELTSARSKKGFGL